MKKSIKWKLTISFIVVIVCLIGSILLFNTLFLEKLYLNNKKMVIKESYYTLEKGLLDAYKENYTLEDLFKSRRDATGEFIDSSLTRFLRELQDKYGVIVVLMDSNNKTYSLFQNNMIFGRRMFNYMFKDNASDKNFRILEKTDKYTIAINTYTNKGPMSEKRITSDSGPTEFYESGGPGETIKKETPKKSRETLPKDNSDLECFGILSDNETAFYLSVPIESIKEPIDLFNRILIVLSIFAIIIGSVVIYFISDSLSKPILKIAEISKKMSRLEFENKYEGNFEDEIGVLGSSINEMSDKLEKSIKELKNANYKLKKDLEKKEELDLMRQEFVANVSHELKTPISLINGYAEGLETEGIADSAETRQYYINVIKDETDKMSKMVRQLLDLSSLERGMDELDFTRINLSEIIYGVVKSFDIKVKDKNINLKIDMDDNIYVWADGYKLEEVIRNYLSNAINHVDNNKLIFVRTTYENQNMVKVSVFNSGVQLSDEERVKIWDKFYKVDKAHTRAYGGTGLGLSIVKAIAKQFNTNCGCENSTIENCKGMEFYFELNTK